MIIFILLFIFCKSNASELIKIKSDTLKQDSTYMVFIDQCIVDSGIDFCQSLFKTYYYDWTLMSLCYLDINGLPMGQFQSYYHNGALKENYSVAKGRKVGMYVSYFDNGIVKEIGRYKDIECYSEVIAVSDTTIRQGEIEGEEMILVSTRYEEHRIGKWLFFCSDGTLDEEKVYE